VYERVIEEDGSVRHSFPFLEKPDPRDKELFHNISVVRPWSKKGQQGGVTQAWTEIAKNMEHAVDSNGFLMFKTLGNQAVKKRFEQIAKEFLPVWKSSSFRSGSDDEAYNTFVELVENVFQAYENFTRQDAQTSAIASVRSQTQTARERDEAISQMKKLPWVT